MCRRSAAIVASWTPLPSPWVFNGLLHSVPSTPYDRKNPLPIKAKDQGDSVSRYNTIQVPGSGASDNNARPQGPSITRLHQSSAKEVLASLGLLL